MTAIAVHGGAGTIRPQHLTPELETLYLHSLQEAVTIGSDILSRGGSALEAVEVAVVVLEDFELFNAGRGSVFSADGKHEMDASIMCGKTRKAGAVAGVSGIKNPVALAAKVLSESDHVLLAGRGAEEFARNHNVKFESDQYFFNQKRYDQWQKVKGSSTSHLDHNIDVSNKKFGTVGAVALDQFNNVAAATSTGGLTNKQFGRIGDSPLNGIGNYANNQTCAVSCTGDGEFFIRGVVAYDISALMEFGGYSLEEACKKVVHERVKNIGGEGGVIALDRFGNISLEFNSTGMYRASKKNDEEIFSSIF